MGINIHSKGDSRMGKKGYDCGGIKLQPNLIELEASKKAKKEEKAKAKKDKKKK